MITLDRMWKLMEKAIVEDYRESCPKCRKGELNPDRSRIDRDYDFGVLFIETDCRCNNCKFLRSLIIFQTDNKVSVNDFNVDPLYKARKLKK